MDREQYVVPTHVSLMLPGLTCFFGTARFRKAAYQAVDRQVQLALRFKPLRGPYLAGLQHLRLLRGHRVLRRRAQGATRRYRQTRRRCVSRLPMVFPTTTTLISVLLRTESAPAKGEAWDEIAKDFDRVILPGYVLFPHSSSLQSADRVRATADSIVCRSLTAHS